jgi:MFS family permease
VIGFPISGLIMDQLSGVLNLAGWQWLFLAEGIPSILVGFWVIYYLDSSIAEAKWLSVEEKTLLSARLEAEDKHKTEHKLRDAFASGKVWVLCAIYFTLMIGLYGITFWLPTIVKAFGVKGYLDVGLITAIPYAVAVVGMMLLSHHSDKTGERRLHYVINVTCGAAGLVLSGIYAGNPYLAITFLSIGTLGVIGSMPLFWPIPSAFLAGTAAAAGIGIVNSVGNLGGYVGPNIPIWAKLVSTDKSAALYMIAGLLMIGAGLTFFLIPKTLRVRVGIEEPGVVVPAQGIQPVR